MARSVIVDVGAGGIGELIARLQGPRHALLLADRNQDALADTGSVDQVIDTAGVSPATAFLLSSEASFITGTGLAVDGGMGAMVRSGALGG